jgi:hypothetical protein
MMRCEVSVYACMHVCMYVYICMQSRHCMMRCEGSVYVCMYVCMYVCICVRLCIHGRVTANPRIIDVSYHDFNGFPVTCSYIHNIHANTHTQLVKAQAGLYIYIYVCMYVYIYIYIYISMHTHTHTHTFSYIHIIHTCIHTYTARRAALGGTSRTRACPSAGNEHGKYGIRGER